MTVWFCYPDNRLNTRVCVLNLGTWFMTQGCLLGFEASQKQKYFYVISCWHYVYIPVTKDSVGLTASEDSVYISITRDSLTCPRWGVLAMGAFALSILLLAVPLSLLDWEHEAKGDWGYNRATRDQRYSSKVIIGYRLVKQAQTISGTQNLKLKFKVLNLLALLGYLSRSH